jgi:hypothetical protein
MATGFGTDTGAHAHARESTHARARSHTHTYTDGTALVAVGVPRYPHRGPWQETKGGVAERAQSARMRQTPQLRKGLTRS